MRPKLLTRPFVLVALANLFVCVASFLLVHLSGFMLDLGAGEAEIGRIMATSHLAAVLSAPFFGRVMDRRGRRVVIMGGATLNLGCVALYLTVDHLSPLLYGLRALEGMAGTMLYASLFTYAADHVPAERRTEGLALFGASGLVPMAVGSSLGDYLLAVGSYRALFLAAVGFALVGLLIALPLRDAASGAAPDQPPVGVLSAARSSALLPVWLAAFAFFFAAGGLFTFFKTFVVVRGIGSVGGFFTAYSAVAVSLRLFAGWLPDRVGVTRMLAPALGFYGLGLAALAFASTSGQVLLAGALCGVGHGYTYPILFSLVVSRAADASRGAAIGVYTAVDFAAHLLAAPLIGWLVESYGYGTGFTASALALLVGVLGFYTLDQRVGAAGSELSSL